MQVLTHLVARELRSESMVSARSYWRDAVWYFDVEKIGRRDTIGTFKWAIDMGDGSTLLDPQWAEQLEDCRVLVYSLVNDRRLGRPLDPHTVTTLIRLRLSKLLTWMVEFGYDNFGQLDSEASWEFYEHVLAAHRKAKDGQVTPLSFQNDLQILYIVHRQGIALADAGANVMPESPYDGESAAQIAERAATAADGWIPPMPDEVALTMLGACFKWMGQPIDDVLTLVDIYQNSNSSTGAKGSIRALQTVLDNFKFSILPGEITSWRRGLGEKPPNSEKRSPHSPRELRALLAHAAGACATLIQGSTGMRISEVVALRGGMNPKTGLPNCVMIRPSKSGLNELFIVESQVTKIYDGSMMEWVIGMRPAGSSYIPPTVIAIQRADALFRPWREACSQKALFINPDDRYSLGHADSPSNAMTISQLTKNMRSFAARYAGLHRLPNELKTSSGTIDLRPYKEGGFKTHQWRKTFALYVLRTDSRMLPAISQHFKHMSMAMTEQGYVGNDPELLDGIDSVRRQRTVLFLLEQATRNTPIAGGMADLVREHRQRLKHVVGDSEGDDAYLRMEEWVIQGDVRIWFSEHGKCLIGLTPDSARCHSIAKTDPWLKRQPNYANRNASVCGGCKCFAVDGEHVEFWRERYRKNALVMAASGGYRGAGYKVAQERTRQSASILRTLGEQVIEEGVRE